jgi:hypothetical protein
MRLHAVAFAAGATLFAAGLLVTEGLGEVALDVDFKPFVIPYLLLTVFPYGMSTLAVGTGAAVGEGLLDVVEGYEFDDPFGFVGYVAGFAAFGWVVHRVAPDPTDRRWQLAAALVGALVQGLFEVAGFALLADPTAVEVAVSAAGNALTHGVLVGGLPLVALTPSVYPWASRLVARLRAGPGR